jgi:uncharacterized protein YggE
MKRGFGLTVVGLLAAAAVFGQTATGTVQAVGSSTVNVTPDQAQLTVGVVTQGATAQEAGQSNSVLATAVQNALKGLIGTAGTIQTVGYSISPRYSNGNTPTIIGYTASNTVQVTTTNLSIIGSLIDTANQAGANNVSGVSFGLQNPEPVLQQALAAASKQALAHAGAMASGLGVKTGAVVSAQEGTSYTPIIVNGAPSATASTPVQTGTVGVSATVTVTVALVP